MIDMGDNIFICVLSHRHKGKMMKLDLNKNTNEILYQWDSNSSVSYSDKWTDSNIVTFYTESTADGYYTQHKRILFFNIDSGKLLDMKYYDILHKPLAYYNTVNDNYAIFYNGASKQTENNTIIIFNGNTGKFYHHNIVFEEPFEKQYIESIVLNESGEMLITTKQNLSSQKHYFIVNVSDIAQ
jgi:hypothetical protein